VGVVSVQNLFLNLKSYFASAVLVWLAILFYRTDPYYKGFLHVNTQHVLIYLAAAYSMGGLIFYALIPGRRQLSRGLVIILALRRLFAEYTQYLKIFPLRAKYSAPKPTEQERIAILFAVVKLFFLPLMINFLFDNYNNFKVYFDSVHTGLPLMTVAGFNTIIFPLVFAAFLIIDTAFFTFGYTLELGFLRNKVRSVEPTLFGWGVALISYPPFSGLLSNYAIWYANDNAYFSSERITFFVRILLLVLTGIYASASVALGPKASNLTNRGIVSWGPYRFIRHPAYISKNLVWWITIIPVLSIAAVLSMLAWSVVYFLRAITEERHLARDPDYREYCKKVRHRFIPGVV